MGVWIEIKTMIQEIATMKSLPAWECGLKLGSGHAGNEPKVVTPCVGVWIEMQWFLVTGWSREMSLPAWECGLK